MISGVYRPHWEDKAYQIYNDEYVIGDIAPFPTDVDQRHFSVFKPVEACPAVDVAPMRMDVGEYFVA